MSLIPRNSSNKPTPFTPFSPNLWDHFFSHNFPFRPFFTATDDFPLLSARSRTIPYSELAVETSGDVRTRLECKEIPEAHLIVAELPGFESHQVEVDAEDDGGIVCIKAVDGLFSWRLRLPEDAKVYLMSTSMENGVFTVVVPKYAVEIDWGREGQSESQRGRGNNVTVVEIEITRSDE